MSFNPNPGRIELVASAGQTVFTFDFKIFLNTDVQVYLTPSGQIADDTTDILILTTDYTVAITGDSGGTVTLVSAASIGDSITIVRVLPITRYIEFQNNGDLLASTLNLDQDYQAYLIADKEADNTRFLKIPNSAQGIETTIPPPTPLNFFQWNAAGDAIVNVNTLIADGYVWTAGDTYTKAETYSQTEVDALIDINSYTEKTTPVDADELALADSAATFSLKKLTWANLKATLKTYFDTLYAVLPSSVSVTGTATFTNTSNNISLIGIGSIGLEVGDVITVSGSVSNDKEFTVEVVTDANNIIVNQGHAGGATTKSLVNETVVVTVNLLAKYYNAAIGRGQGVVDVVASRTLGVGYPNNTNRTMHISIYNTTGITPQISMSVDGITVDSNLVRNAEGTGYGSVSYPVPSGSTYIITSSTAAVVWSEQR